MVFRYLTLWAWLVAVTCAQNLTTQSGNLDVVFRWDFPEKIVEGQSCNVTFVIGNSEEFLSPSGQRQVELTNSRGDVALIEPINFDASEWSPDSNWSATFNFSGLFLGYTEITVRLWDGNGSSRRLVAQSAPHRMAVVRPQKLVDTIFISTVAILITISFVNMGCTLDLKVVLAAVKRPIGPAIGFTCQYLFMPLCSFGLAKWLLSHNAALQLGLFITGCSPGGGASNIWTHILGGNIHLSITMTGISTIAAFAMMPLWTMTLGRLIFSEGTIVVPYGNIATVGAGFSIPLLIGLVIRSFWPKVAAFMAQSLKPLSLIIIAVIIGFGTYANLYLFYLMDWQVLVSSFCLVWLGYGFGATASILCRQPWNDALAVAIETGIQNTGIAIFVLRLMLDQPEADINTVVPVAVSIASPLPLCFLWFLQKCIFNRLGICRRDQCADSESADPKPKDVEPKETSNK